MKLKQDSIKMFCCEWQNAHHKICEIWKLNDGDAHENFQNLNECLKLFLKLALYKLIQHLRIAFMHRVLII